MQSFAVAVWLVAVFTVDGRSPVLSDFQHSNRAEQYHWSDLNVAFDKSKTSTERHQQSNEEHLEDYESIHLSEDYPKHLYESDISLNEGQWSSFSQRNSIDSELRRWSTGSDGYPLVPYIYIDSVNRTAVMAGFDHWMEHTCIKFEETTNTEQPHMQIVDQNRCWSEIGMLFFRNGQTISIGGQYCSNFGTILHEVGHGMGLWHEQSRSDRDDYINFFPDNYYYDSTSIQADNNYSVPYDYTSIMQYGEYYFNINGKPVMQPKDILAKDFLGSRRLNRNKLSHRNKLLVNRMYNCTDKWLSSCGISSEPCLNDGYTGKDCTCICPPGTSGSNCEEVLGHYYGDPGCGGAYSSDTGMIQHPVDGGNYTEYEHCIWIIKATQPIEINFEHFDTEVNFDYLYVRDGESNDPQMLVDFNGNTLPDPVHISTNEAYLLFKTDRSVSKTGFKLQWGPTGGHEECVNSVRVGQKCLTFSDEILNWNAAKESCENNGGKLASLSNPSDPGDLLVYYLRNYGGKSFWLGGLDQQEEGKWTWLNGEPFVQFIWGYGQPDNRGNQDCLQIGWRNAYDDSNCRYGKRFICEKTLMD